MSFEEEFVTDNQREACAVMVMQRVLEKYSEKHKVSFNEAINKFASSNLYTGLFDYTTRLWAEGPDFLLNLFEKALASPNQ